VNDPESRLDEPALRAALSLVPFDGGAAQRLMEPAGRAAPPASLAGEGPRPAAALAYVFEERGRLKMPLTLRHSDLREHASQVSLPGGRPEVGESLWETARREAREEIGLEGVRLERLGTLTPVYIPLTHTALQVFVAWGAAPGTLRANPGEVERVQVVPLTSLLDPTLRKQRLLRLGAGDREVPYFDLAGLFVWGATAMALSELAERLRQVMGAS